MNNKLAAALPLAIALLGSGALPTRDESASTRVRVAPTAAQRSVELLGLTDEQVSWLGEHNPFGIPRTTFPGDRTLVIRQGYTLAHNNVDLIADWVAFHLTKAYVEGTEKRPGTSYFKPDPMLPVGRRAELTDYKGWKGVWDRGHQCANNDSKGRGVRVIRESFLLSNMTPQSSRLNQYKWRLLEERIQELATKRGELWVITGPVFVDDDGDGLVTYSVLGRNQVAVPTHYFKIVLAADPDVADGWQAMTFLIPNKPMVGEYSDYLDSIDRIEELTGFDFFAAMEKAQQDRLEAEIAPEVWALS